MSFTILGTGSYALEHVVTNDDLAQLVETNDEWITQRIGVKSRHISEMETNVDLAVKAAGARARGRGRRGGGSLTRSSRRRFPATRFRRARAAWCRRHRRALSGVRSGRGVLGFLFALETAAGFFARGMYKRILVVSAERMSGIID